MTVPPFGCSTTYVCGTQRSILIDRPMSWTSQHKRDNARHVEEIAFISRRPEPRSPIADADQLDRTEAIRQPDGEDRHRKQNDGRNAHQRNECADQKREAGNGVCSYRDATHAVPARSPRRTED